MAVQVLERRPGILSNIGNLASLAGMATGQPWLTALGAGANFTDGIVNGFGTGGTSSAAEVLGKLKDAITGWKNPASGNIAKAASKAAKAAKAITPATGYDELLARGWGAWS